MRFFVTTLHDICRFTHMVTFAGEPWQGWHCQVLDDPQVGFPLTMLWLLIVLMVSGLS